MDYPITRRETVPAYHRSMIPGFQSHSQTAWRRGVVINLWWRFWVVLVACLLVLYSISILSGREDSGQERCIEESQQDLNCIEESTLIDLFDFKYLLNNRSTCENKSDIFLVSFVHSKPDHFLQRSVIRNSWGSVQQLNQWRFKLVFMLGTTTAEIQRNIELENNKHGDIIQGSFCDSYRNLTYKHVMGYKWVTSYCSVAKFVLKADDDVFIDIYQLYLFLNTFYRVPPINMLLCNVIPDGTTPKRFGKWKVSKEEYSGQSYPKYCGGLAYVITPNLLRRLLAASSSVPYFWIDDVYVTGMLSERIGLKNVTYNQLNLRTTYELAPLLDWATKNDTKASPFLVGTVEKRNNSQTFNLLWRKTVKVWSSNSIT